MSDKFPTFDDLIFYRRNRLVAQLNELGLMDAAVARERAVGLLLDYVNDEEVRRACAWAVRGRPEGPHEGEVRP